MAAVFSAVPRSQTFADSTSNHQCRGVTGSDPGAGFPAASVRRAAATRP